MKKFLRTAWFFLAVLFVATSCGREEAEPECIAGIVLTNQGCPDAVLIQVLNKPGLGRTVVFGNAFNAVMEYDNVVKTTYPFDEDIAALRGRTIYFRYSQPNLDKLQQVDAPTPCQAIYVNYDVPYVDLRGYSFTDCLGN